MHRHGGIMRSTTHDHGTSGRANNLWKPARELSHQRWSTFCLVTGQRWRWAFLDVANQLWLAPFDRHLRRYKRGCHRRRKLKWNSQGGLQHWWGKKKQKRVDNGWRQARTEPIGIILWAAQIKCPSRIRFSVYKEPFPAQQSSLSEGWPGSDLSPSIRLTLLDKWYGTF